MSDLIESTRDSFSAPRCHLNDRLTAKSSLILNRDIQARPHAIDHDSLLLLLFIVFVAHDVQIAAIREAHLMNVALLHLLEWDRIVKARAAIAIM